MKLLILSCVVLLGLVSFEVIAGDQKPTLPVSGTQENEEISHEYNSYMREGSKFLVLENNRAKTTFAMAWVTQAIANVFTMGPHDYIRGLQNAELYFTEDGWNKFQKILNEEGILKEIKLKERTLLSVVNGAPVLRASKTVENNMHRYAFEVPTVLTYRKLGKYASKQVTFMVMVEHALPRETGANIKIVNISKMPVSIKGN